MYLVTGLSYLMSSSDYTIFLLITIVIISDYVIVTHKILVCYGQKKHGLHEENSIDCPSSKENLR